MNDSEIHDSVFLLMAYESIKYILSKKIEKKEKNEEIEKLGMNLGEKITNFLMNDSQRDSDYFIDSKKILIFIAEDVWDFIFKDKNIKLIEDQKGIFYIYSGDIKLYNFLIVDKNYKLDEKSNAVIKFICGILKGALNAFNIDSLITSNVKEWNNNERINKSNLLFEFSVNIVNYEFKNIK
jgi:hypothetical protein